MAFFQLVALPSTRETGATLGLRSARPGKSSAPRHRSVSQKRKCARPAVESALQEGMTSLFIAAAVSIDFKHCSIDPVCPSFGLRLQFHITQSIIASVLSDLHLASFL